MKKKLSSLFILVIFSFISSSIFSQTIVGKWKTIDDETGLAKSVVNIYKGSDGKYYGKIEKLFRKADEDQNPLCTKCSDSNKNKPIIGLVIINGMVQDDDEWEDGTILDPANGKVYDCEMWIEDGKLHVRGYIGLSVIGRSQVWLPY